MKEYIERETLLTELQEELDFETNMYTEEQNKWFNIGLKCAIRDVKTLPAADVAPVVHGKWVKEVSHNGCTYDYDCVCSICGEDGFIKDSYCRHCGARMDGGK